MIALFNYGEGPMSTRVLVVENNRETLDGMVNHFLEKGFDVAAADCSAKALRELAVADPLPVVIMLNLYMPALDGWSLLQSIAGDVRYQNIGILLMHYDGVDDRSLAFDSAAEALVFAENDGQLNHIFMNEWASGKKTVA